MLTTQDENHDKKTTHRQSPMKLTWIGNCAILHCARRKPVPGGLQAFNRIEFHADQVAWISAPTNRTSLAIQRKVKLITTGFHINSVTVRARIFGGNRDRKSVV